MNAQTAIETPLAKLRVPFADHHVSKLPKPTKAQTEAVRDDFKKGIRCKLCGSWHHPDVVHLDYVGHAALTDRLLDTDIEWYWEPLAFTDQGLPAFDQTGGLWIKLTVAGVTRLGYGHAASKQNADPGAREKEVIGDALRNAAMRFGAALDLWHKGDLHAEEESEPNGASGDTAGERKMSAAGSNTSVAAGQQAAIAKIIQLCEAVGDDQSSKVCKAYKVKDMRELTSTQAKAVIDRLTEKLAEKAKAPTNAEREFSEITEDLCPF